MGKGENAGNQHFLLFPQCFQEYFLSDSIKTRHFWEVNRLHEYKILKTFSGNKLNLVKVMGISLEKVKNKTLWDEEKILSNGSQLFLQ